ncbi:hypothetical protein OGAPHI_003726 [Ogataea philodendri]|uniref:Splicing factor YJU2 n=1 Tax=Ogataea philodendri TaxID=1378263 RepID=A0A9P8T4Y5_9ASCO|nr:uncharacterized protein OGAPHI_003726 [Ogataea philodendri]KAH3665540.1 hypothetical protein OGAPHI_003726 [Ogataea philodendri]
MSERKAINKYYPPDYDPLNAERVPKVRKSGSAGWPTVRLMIPFSMKCLKCGEYIAKSKKFNAKKENSKEDYLGIRIFHFHFRCPQCYDDLVFRTDPKNGDFECVSGCKRNYERKEGKIAADETLDEMLKRLEEEERKELLAKEGKKENEESAMEQLERRLLEQQKEQELVEEIEELQERGRRLEKAKVPTKVDLEKQDEKEAELAFRSKSKQPVDIPSATQPAQSSLFSGYSSSDEETVTVKRKKSSLGIRKKIKV